MDAWERLRWARNRWAAAHPECATAQDAANRFGWKPVTYRSHERRLEDNGRGFDLEAAKGYARAYGVSWLWLFSGDGEPVSGSEPELVKISGLVVPGARIEIQKGSGVGDFAPRLSHVSESARVVEVRGAVAPFAEDGALIWYEHPISPPGPEMLGQLVVVELDTGEVLIRRLLRSSPGVFDLEAFSGPLRRDVRLKGAARIVAIIPPLEARRSIVRANTRSAD